MVWKGWVKSASSGIHVTPDNAIACTNSKYIIDLYQIHTIVLSIMLHHGKIYGKYPLCHDVHVPMLPEHVQLVHTMTLLRCRYDDYYHFGNRCGTWMLLIISATNRITDNTVLIHLCGNLYVPTELPWFTLFSTLKHYLKSKRYICKV
jgi:hypothetical protein